MQTNSFFELKEMILNESLNKTESNLPHYLQIERHTVNDNPTAPFDLPYIEVTSNVRTADDLPVARLVHLEDDEIHLHQFQPLGKVAIVLQVEDLCAVVQHPATGSAEDFRADEFELSNDLPCLWTSLLGAQWKNFATSIKRVPKCLRFGGLIWSGDRLRVVVI